ncbi:MAG: hypothetical protein ACI4AO_02905 [Anaerotignum sp.]
MDNGIFGWIDYFYTMFFSGNNHWRLRIGMVFIQKRTMVVGSAATSALFPAGNDPCAESGGGNFGRKDSDYLCDWKYSYMDIAADLCGESAKVEKESGIGRNED